MKFLECAFSKISRPDRRRVIRKTYLRSAQNWSWDLSHGWVKGSDKRLNTSDCQSSPRCVQTGSANFSPTCLVTTVPDKSFQTRSAVSDLHTFVSRLKFLYVSGSVWLFIEKLINKNPSNLFTNVIKTNLILISCRSAKQLISFTSQVFMDIFPWRVSRIKKLISYHNPSVAMTIIDFLHSPTTMQVFSLTFHKAANEKLLSSLRNHSWYNSQDINFDKDLQGEIIVNTFK